MDCKLILAAVVKAENYILRVIKESKNQNLAGSEKVEKSLDLAMSFELPVYRYEQHLTIVALRHDYSATKLAMCP